MEGGEKEEKEALVAATTVDYLFQILNSCLSRAVCFDTLYFFPYIFVY